MQNTNVAAETGFAIRGDRRIGIVRLFVSGTLDAFTVPILERELDAVAYPGGALILDLGDVIAIDRFGLDALEAAGQRANRDGWRLSVVNSNDAVRRVFEASGDDQLLSATDVSHLLDAGDGEWSPIPLPPILERPARRPPLGRS
ncbi:MAG TPA: STAS domain-containing protein [Actinomycetota bacterium]